MRSPRWRRALGGALALMCCAGSAQTVAPPRDTEVSDPTRGTTAFNWSLPRGFPEPFVPAGNPMSEDKVRLGRLLFHEPRLSVTGQQACSTCHQPELAFTDGKARAVGATSQLHPRSAMSLTNVAYNAAFTWADPTIGSLEAQVLQPLFNEHPVEMGLTGRETQVIGALRREPRYATLFGRAFPESADPFSLANVARALASFERTLISGRSAFDRYVFDDDGSGMSAAARRGMALFYSPRIGCAQCHSGINFCGPPRTRRHPDVESIYANTGLYNTDGHGAYPPDAPGIAAVTGNPKDQGRFRVPTLRNVAVTAPYMHDGSIGTLAEVIDHYAAGGRQSPLGPATRNSHRDSRIRPFQVTAQERTDLVAFLESLTDAEFLRDTPARAPDPRTTPPARE
jgi:cytochrome c peroxidase